MNDNPARQRLDKWLWAARFFKTRGLAAEAIRGGKIKLNGYSVKPAKETKVGDILEVRVGQTQWTVIVCGLNEYRRPASEAQQLYQESAESLLSRQRVAEQQSLAPNPGASIKGRPTKRDRRKVFDFLGS